MIFEVLHAAAENGELLLVEGGLCRYHLRQDGQVTIREILATPERRGTGRRLLALLTERVVGRGATSLFAKCPASLDANGWYRYMGFRHEGSERTPKGTVLHRWRLRI